jgi:hypothetical protein
MTQFDNTTFNSQDKVILSLGLKRRGVDHGPCGAADSVALPRRRGCTRGRYVHKKGELADDDCPRQTVLSTTAQGTEQA